jgi:hypothetical protein
MAEPEKETVRIALPPRPDKASPSASAAKHDTVRIVLPSRTPPTPVRRVPPAISPRCSPIAPPPAVAASPLLHPLPKPPGPETSAEPRAAITPLPPVPELRSARPTPSGPKKETARITIVPRPTAKPLDPFDALPRPFCWGLFGIVTLIFLIQIWNYVVS